MTKTVQAVYTNGALRLLEPVDLAENTKVTVIIANGSPTTSDDAWLDTEFHAACAFEADPSVSLDEVRAALSTIPGSLTEDFIAERDER